MKYKSITVTSKVSVPYRTGNNKYILTNNGNWVDKPIKKTGWKKPAKNIWVYPPMGG